MAAMPEEVMVPSKGNSIDLSPVEKRVYSAFFQKRRGESFTQEELGLNKGYDEYQALQSLIDKGLIEEHPTTPGVSKMYKVPESFYTNPRGPR